MSRICPESCLLSFSVPCSGIALPKFELKLYLQVRHKRARIGGMEVDGVTIVVVSFRALMND
jgi:hypothetical protein